MKTMSHDLLVQVAYLIVIQNVQFEFRQVLRHYHILNGHLRSQEAVATAFK